MIRDKQRKWRWAARVLYVILLAAACGCFYSYAASINLGGEQPAAETDTDARDNSGRTNSPLMAQLPGDENRHSGVIHRGEPNDFLSNEQEVIETACVLIEQGKFDAAGQLIEATDYEKQGWKPIWQ